MSCGSPLPRLDPSVPPAPALLTLSTATAPSPCSANTQPASDVPRRSNSKRLERVKELLSPKLGEGSSNSPVVTGPTSIDEVIGEEDEEECKVHKDGDSKIHFFSRHPLDSRNPLTFLDTSSGGDDGSGGGGGGRSSNEWEDLTSNGEAQGSPVASSPREIPSAKGRSSSSSSAEGPFFGDQLLGYEPKPLRARPMSLHDMPGRYRSLECCWGCADGTVGEECRFCGLVVKQNSVEDY
ncbi:MAG: hypothetical protein Q9219_005370 [cf. Caloplaca sp. 3 TL-2023]